MKSNQIERCPLSSEAPHLCLDHCTWVQSKHPTFLALAIYLWKKLCLFTGEEHCEFWEEESQPNLKKKELKETWGDFEEML